MTWTLLVSLLAKSSLVAGAGLLCARYLTRQPVERVDILRGTVCLLLALPVIMNVLPPLELALLPPLDIPAASALAAATPTAPLAPAAPWWTSPGAMLGGLWLLGAALVSGHLVFGLNILRRWTQAGRPVTAPEWLEPIEHLPPVDRPGVVASDHVAGPISWGVAPGAILLDPATLSEPRSAPAIMAHELAHLRRQDWLFLILSRVVLAIFWFNPLVWRLHASLAERAEEAADAIAVGSVDRALYAHTLVRLAASPAPFMAARAALPMAANARNLKTRIACLMTQAPERRRPVTVALTLAALAVAATPLAAFGLTRQAAPVSAPAPLAQVAVAATPEPSSTPAPPKIASPVARAAPAEPPQPSATPAPPAPPAPSASVETWDFGARPYLSSEDVSAIRQATEQIRVQAEQVRLSAEDARKIAEEARRQVEAHRGEIETAARLAAQQARLSAEDARRIGKQARQAGERARTQALKQASLGMARGAEQMRAGALQMRAEAERLADPAYRARQIEESRARGDTVTDQALRDLARRLPSQADDLDRQAERMAARARDMAS